jgi:oligosaccharide repeat unit polymerase
MITMYFLLAIILILSASSSLKDRQSVVYGRMFAVLGLSYGLLIKPLFVALDLPSEEFIQENILAPLTPSEYWGGSIMLLGCYALFVVTMLITTAMLRHGGPYDANRPAARFSVGGAWFLALVGMLGLAAFLAQNPGFLTGASKNILATEDLAEYSSGGVSRLVISILYFIPFFMISNIGARFRVNSSRQLLWISASCWVAFGFISDQRGMIIFSVFSWFVMYRIAVGTIQKKHLISATILAVVMVVVRTVMRIATEDGGALAAADDIIGNYIGRNLVENGKTLIIIKAVPERLAYALGDTYFDSIIILIPRSLLAAKQTVNIDTIIGMGVFDCRFYGACGVPPGLIAESYFNFGALGVLVLMPLCGWLTAWLDWKVNRCDGLQKILYAASLVYFALSVLGSSVAAFVTQFIMHIVILLITYHALRVHRQVRTPIVKPGAYT